MGEIQNDIENKAEELKDSSTDQHLGDAMDDAEPGSGDGTEQDAGDTQDDLEDKAEEPKDSSTNQHLGNALDDVDLEPPSS